MSSLHPQSQSERTKQICAKYNKLIDAAIEENERCEKMLKKSNNAGFIGKKPLNYADSRSSDKRCDDEYKNINDDDSKYNHYSEVVFCILLSIPLAFLMLIFSYILGYGFTYLCDFVKKGITIGFLLIIICAIFEFISCLLTYIQCFIGYGLQYYKLFKKILYKSFNNCFETTVLFFKITLSKIYNLKESTITKAIIVKNKKSENHQKESMRDLKMEYRKIKADIAKDKKKFLKATGTANENTEYLYHSICMNDIKKIKEIIDDAAALYKINEQARLNTGKEYVEFYRRNKIYLQYQLLKAMEEIDEI